MTEQQKGGLKLAGGITLAGIAAALALWPQAKEVLLFVADAAEYALAKPTIHALLMGVALAAFAGFALPRWLPGDWTPARTRTVTGITSALIGLSAVLVLVPTRSGFIYALLAGFASPTVSAALRQLRYWAKPDAKPESLRQ